MSKAVWKSQLSSNKEFKDEFKKWMDRALTNPAHCVCMTGHHWSHEAWGWATKRWKPGRARARDKDGKFYKYKENRKGWPEPVKA